MLQLHNFFRLLRCKVFEVKRENHLHFELLNEMRTIIHSTLCKSALLITRLYVHRTSEHLFLTNLQKFKFYYHIYICIYIYI